MCIKGKKGKVRREEFMEGKKKLKELLNRKQEEKKGRKGRVKEIIQLSGCVEVYK